MQEIIIDGVTYNLTPKAQENTVYKEDEFKVREWLHYKSGISEAIFRYKNMNGDTDEYYQIYLPDESIIGEGKSDNFTHSFKEIQRATPEQIKRILSIVAKQKGFKEGVKFKSAYMPQVLCKLEHTFKCEYLNHCDRLNINGYAVYENGKWAEILSSYPEITINGYKGEFFDNYVKFGCAKISKHIFEQLNDMYAIAKDSNREIESVTIGKGTFTKEQIRIIAEYYINK